MNRWMIAALSTLALSSVVVPAHAETTAATAAEVVELGRQGHLSDQGIPGYGRLSAQVQTGRLTAEELIQAAIAAGRVNDEALTDVTFVNAVEADLESLSDR